MALVQQCFWLNKHKHMHLDINRKMTRGCVGGDETGGLHVLVAWHGGLVCHWEVRTCMHLQQVGETNMHTCTHNVSLMHASDVD